MHFYLDHNMLPSAGQSTGDGYGPDGINPSDQFQITSRFQLTGTAKAFAPLKGHIIVQPNDSNPTDLVNIILKPQVALDINFTAVKYFIFRGIKKDSFFTATDSITPQDSGNNEMIARLWQEHIDWKNSSGLSSAPDPDATVLGYDPLANSSIKLDSVYANQQSFEFFPVNEGEWIGNFTDTVKTGFEVVLEEGDFIPDLSFARLNQYTIDISLITDSFDVKVAREEILNFCDPTAFFGLFFYTGLDTEGGMISGATLYQNILAKHETKNRVYLDIRNEIGYSLNFYENYDDGSGNSLKLGNADNAASPIAYNTTNWPIVIIEGGLNSTDTRNKILLNLRIGDNIKPIIYLVHAEQANPTRTLRFLDENRLLPSTVDGYTREVSFLLPNYDDSSSRLYIPWYVKLHYCRQKDASTSWPTGVLKTEQYTDTIFGPLNLERLGDINDKFKFIFNQDIKYINGNLPGSTESFGYIAERGISWDDDDGNPTNDRVVFFARTLYANKSTSQFFAPKTGINETAITEGITLNNTFFNVSLLKQNLRITYQRITDGTDQILLPVMDDNSISTRNTENLLLLLISQNDFNNLKGVFLGSGFKTNHHGYVKLMNETFDSAQSYYKYELHVHGLDSVTLEDKVEPTTPLTYVYSKDGLIFTSAEFSEGIEQIANEIPRNYEENMGAKIKSPLHANQYPIFFFDIANNEIKIQGSLNPYYELPLLTTLTSSKKTITVAGSPGNDGVYTINNVTKIGNDTIIKVEEALLNPSVGGDIYYTLSYEDYFISLDNVGSISSSNLGIQGKEMRQLASEFAVSVNNVADDANVKVNLEAVMMNYASKILNRARAFVQQTDLSGDYINPDDRILYWTRIQMEVVLKNHPFLRNSDIDREDLIQLFEEKSRGYTTVDFASAPSGAIKLLVTGFDPFQLATNPLQSNPSGPCSLSLHGKTLNTGTKDVYIQSMIMPVRYRDFENGIVEEHIAPLIGGGTNKADMIITISQSGIGNFNIDRFATINRSGSKDNLSETRTANSNSVQLTSTELATWKYIETTLPKAMAQLNGDVSDPSPNLWGHSTVYAQHYIPIQSQLPSMIPVIPDYKLEWDALQETLKFKFPNLALTYTLKPDPPSIIPTNTLMRSGSGGKYLSNEIFYRVALAREKWQLENPSLPKFPTGHFHVAWIQIFPSHDLSNVYTAFELTNIIDSNGESSYDWTTPKNSSRTIMDELKRLLRTVEDRIKRGIESYDDENDLF